MNPVNPVELREFRLREAMSDLPATSTLTAEAQWASRWARVLWARANLDPPGPLRFMEPAAVTSPGDPPPRGV